MSSAVICCKMIERELKNEYTKNGLSCPVFWLPADLHNYPDKLRETLQETLDNMPEEVDRVIMTYGLCGKAVIGLKTRGFELVMPKTDDCIALLLGSNEEKINNKATYFITDNWLSDEKSLFSEYEYTLNKYGKEKSERIFKRQFVNYKTLGVVDTGCYDIESVINRAENIRRILQLTTKVIPANLHKLNYLLSPFFDTKSKEAQSDYLVIPANSEITEKMFFEFLN